MVDFPRNIFTLNFKAVVICFAYIAKVVQISCENFVFFAWNWAKLTKNRSKNKGIFMLIFDIFCLNIIQYLDKILQNWSYIWKIEPTKSKFYILSVFLETRFHGNRLSENAIFYTLKWWSNKWAVLPWQRKLILTKTIYFHHQCKAYTTYKENYKNLWHAVANRFWFLQRIHINISVVEPCNP